MGYRSCGYKAIEVLTGFSLGAESIAIICPSLVVEFIPRRLTLVLIGG
jgi:hypothetical protein